MYVLCVIRSSRRTSYEPPPHNMEFEIEPILNGRGFGFDVKRQDGTPLLETLSMVLR